MKPAPIALFVYNRPDHVDRVLQALSQNYLADQSMLYIFSDGPRSAQDQEKVERVRAIIRQDRGFKSVQVFESENNNGLSKSLVGGINLVLEEHDSIIVLEDDIYTAKGFLDFINNGLHTYKDNEEVISIHGYNFPINKKFSENFFLRGADCWGWGTWKRGWQLFESNGILLRDKIKTSDEVADFNFYNSYPYMKMLEDNIDGKNDSWAIRWYASAYVNHKLTLYPRQSLVHNIGLDGSGENCGDYNDLGLETFDSNLKISMDMNIIEENIKAKKTIAAWNNYPAGKFRHYLQKVKSKLKLIQ